MYRMISFILLLVIVSSGFAQKKFSKDYLETKLESFKNMKSKGQSLVGAGIACNVIGLGMMVFGASGIDSEDGGSVGVFLVGYILFWVGIPLDIAGGVVWGIGSSRVRTYEKLLKEYDKELSLGFTNRGLTLQLRL